MEASDWPLGVEGHLPGRGGGPTALSPLHQTAARNFRVKSYRAPLPSSSGLFTHAPNLASPLLAFALLPAYTRLVQLLVGLLVPCVSRQGPKATARRSSSPEIEETD